MVLCGNTAEYLYIGRVFAGATGGGMYICLPLFVAEIADQRLVERKIHILKGTFISVFGLRFSSFTNFTHINLHSIPNASTHISHSIRLSCRQHDANLIEH